jgi:hypothetical protein
MGIIRADSLEAETFVKRSSRVDPEHPDDHRHLP